MFELLTTPEIKERITQKAHVIMPKTWWTGEKKDSGVIDTYEPGTREDTGFKAVLHTGTAEEEMSEAKKTA
jgi:hypothetical protein